MAAKKKDETVEETKAPKLSRVEVLRQKLEAAEQAEKLAAESRKIAQQERFGKRLANAAVKVETSKKVLDRATAAHEEAKANYDALVAEGKELGVEVEATTDEVETETADDESTED